MLKTIQQKPRDLINIRAAIYGQPWAITEQWLNTICNIVESHVAGKPVTFKSEDDESDDDEQDNNLGFDLIDNVAVIPIEGPIIPKATWLSRLSALTSLEEIMESIEQVYSLRPNAVILNIDSPGGSVTGLSDFCETLYEIGQGTTVPLIALANPLCASAAYMIASQCDMVYATNGAVVGSIGTVGRMDNWDRAERNEGNDPVVFRSHELKGIGAGQITPNQITEMQRQMMAYDAKFKQAVTRGRPFVNMEKVATGQVWMGQSANGDPSAKDMGIIDGTSTLQKLINQYGTK